MRRALRISSRVYRRLAGGALRHLAFKRDVKTLLNSGLFDDVWYAKVAKKVGLSTQALVRHYLLVGAGDGLSPNQLFDATWYNEKHGGETGDQNPLLHYLRDGWRRGYDPHPLFSVGFYLSKYADVRDAGYEPLMHFIKFGFREGRSPCDEFDTAYYIEQNADVAAQGINPLCHYVEYGASEGRSPSMWFDAAWYSRAVLKGSRVNPLVHLRANGSSDASFTKIAMGADYSISDDDYRHWVRTCAAMVSASSMSELISRLTVVRTPSETSASFPAGPRYGLNETSLPRLLADREGGSEQVYLFCDETDEIETSLLPSLLASAKSPNALCTFDFVAASGSRWTPVLLPGANPAHIKAVDASFSRFVIAGELLSQLVLGEGVTPYDILRKAIERLQRTDRLSSFVHVPQPLLRARELTASVKGARAELDRHDPLADRIRRRPKIARATSVGNSVSVVICTKDRCYLLAQLLDNLLRLDRTFIRDIVVVTNADAGSYASKVHAQHANLDRVTFLKHDGPYNFSLQSNRGAAQGAGELVLFLNDDIVPIGSDWLEHLRSPFAESAKVGITGPLLLYPDERTQHAGMYLGFNGCAGHTLRGLRLPESDYFFNATAPRNVSVVTGAALLTDRKLFESLNGFDRQLGTYLQDVDYCLRVRNLDRDILYQPTSRLFHMESVSMRETEGAPVFSNRRPLEHARFMRKWSDALSVDEFRNPNLDVQDETQRTIVRRAA